MTLKDRFSVGLKYLCGGRQFRGELRAIQFINLMNYLKPSEKRGESGVITS
jgi:hypothetical protein